MQVWFFFCQNQYFFLPFKRKAGPVLANDDYYCNIILLGGLGSCKLHCKEWWNQWSTNLNGGTTKRRDEFSWLQGRASFFKKKLSRELTVDDNVIDALQCSKCTCEMKFHFTKWKSYFCERNYLLTKMMTLYQMEFTKVTLIRSSYPEVFSEKSCS